MSNSSIQPIDRTHRSGATTSGLSGTGSNGKEGVLRIPPSSSVIGASSSDCLVSELGDSWRGSYPSTEMQSVYFTALADWVSHTQKTTF